jgi:hypothetical protein
MSLARPRSRTVLVAVVVPLSAAIVSLALSTPALAGPTNRNAPPGWGRHTHVYLLPGNLLVSRSVYRNDPNIVAGQTALPPGCSDPSSSNPNCKFASTNGDYPYVFNNDSVDGSFGVTSPIFLDELTPTGRPIGSLEVPNSDQPYSSPTADQVVTSFSSKSELALNLSTDGNYVTFVGYKAPVDTADVSNANTPGVVDPTNPVPGAYYRVVTQLDKYGRFRFTETNAFSGDNGRAAILNDENGSDLYYAAGNAGNGSNPEPNGVVLGAGAQLIQPSDQPESQQSPSDTPTPVGSFNIDQLGDAVDKSAKDDNFRGLAVFDNVVYYTKGSGGNGIDSVYFVDTTGKSCPSGGVGLPQPGASLPTTSDFTINNFQTNPKKTADPGLTPENMCILKGFPTLLATDATDSSDYPFGIWFANPHTLYVADEGSGDNTNTTFTSTSNGTYSAAAASTTAGLQKWVFDSTTGQWNLAYVLQSGLHLGQPYDVRGYPTGINSTSNGGTGLPWAPATDGLRNLTGRVNPNGTVSIWAVTSTVSGGGDQGADPNEVVEVTDNPAATSAPSGETFRTVAGPTYGTVFRGVSFTPGTHLTVSGSHP